MKVADALVTALADLGVGHVFGVYGSGNAWIIDQFHREKRTQFVHTITEACAGYAAEAYQKVGNPIGVALATSGPGATNLVTPIANCFYDSVPCLFLTGNSPLGFQRPNETVRQIGFQEAPIVDLVKPIVKAAEVLRDPDRLLSTVERLLQTARTGRPGPVLLDLPSDVQQKEIGYRKPELKDPSPSEPENEADISRFVRAFLAAFREAKRPLVLVGGGARSVPVEQLRELYDKTEIPFLPTWNALDLVPRDWAAFGGTFGTYGCGVGRNFALQQADLVLALGTRISGRHTGGQVDLFARSAKVFWVDVDPGVVGPGNHPFSLDRVEKLQCNLRTFLPWLLNSLVRMKKSVARWQWEAEVANWKVSYNATVENADGEPDPPGINPYRFTKLLSDVAPANAIITSECGGQATIVHAAFAVRTGQRLFSSHGHSPMGAGLGYGIGAAFGAPDRPVLCTVGDGGLAASLADLQTAAIHRNALRNLIVFVYNNRIYGITKQFQVDKLESRFIACGPDPESGYAAPDFVGVAERLGLHATKIDARGIFPIARKLESAISSGGPAVYDVRMDNWHTYAPRISRFDQPLEEATPSLSEDDFLINLNHAEPLPGWQERRR